MTPEALIHTVASRLGIDPRQIQAQASIRSSHWSAEYGIPPQVYTNWVVRIEGQDDFLEVVDDADASE